MQVRPRIEGSSIWVAGVCLLALLLWGVRDAAWAQKQKKDATKESLVWSVNLRTFGDTLPTQNKNERAVWPLFRGVTFTEHGQLVAHFVSYAAGALSSRVELAPSDPYQLHVLFFDSSTGTLRDSAQWPTRPLGFTQVLPTSGDNLLVLTYNRLGLYSADLRKLKEQVFPVNPDFELEGWYIVMAPNGRRFLLRYGHLRAKQEQWKIWNSRSLEPVGDWDDGVTRSSASLTDNAVVWGSEEGINIRRDGQLPQMLYRKSRGWPMGINSHAIVTCEPPQDIRQGCAVLVALSMRGEVLIREPLRKGEVLAQVRTGFGDNLFAISTVVSTASFFDTNLRVSRSRVAVYDLRSRSSILSMDTDPTLFLDFAISPDEKFIAILLGSEIRVYRLPQPGAAGGVSD